jgi:hypothetical protein
MDESVELKSKVGHGSKRIQGQRAQKGVTLIIAGVTIVELERIMIESALYRGNEIDINLTIQAGRSTENEMRIERENEKEIEIEKEEIREMIIEGEEVTEIEVMKTKGATVAEVGIVMRVTGEKNSKGIDVGESNRYKGLEHIVIYV